MNPSPNAAPAPIRLALIEDSVAYAAELTTFLNQLPDMGVLGAYTEAKAALAGLAKLTVDVVISDIGLPDCSGIELIPKIRALQPQAEVMMLTVFENDEVINQALEMGASGFLLKRSSPEEIAASLRRVHQGGVAFSDTIAQRILTFFRERGERRPYLPALTPQENRLLGALSDGVSLKVAAGQIGVTYESARTYTRSIYRKMAVNSMVQAVRLYLQHRPD